MKTAASRVGPRKMEPSPVRQLLFEGAGPCNFCLRWIAILTLLYQTDEEYEHARSNSLHCHRLSATETRDGLEQRAKESPLLAKSHRCHVTCLFDNSTPINQTSLPQAKLKMNRKPDNMFREPRRSSLMFTY